MATDHEWMRQWEEQGDSPLRYFLEPTYLTVNYAKAAGYEKIYMAGLSGGGWSTTFAAAIDKRIDGSFPIAGSLPCDMRNPESWDHPQSWTGDSDEDFEQSWYVVLLHLSSYFPGLSDFSNKIRKNMTAAPIAPIRTQIPPAQTASHRRSILTRAAPTRSRVARRFTSAITPASICWPGWSRGASRRRSCTSTTRVASRRTTVTRS